MKQLNYSCLRIYLAFKKAYPDWSIGVEMTSSVAECDARMQVDRVHKIVDVFISDKTTSDQAAVIIAKLRG